MTKHKTYRKDAPFKSADDLTQVKGIGKATLERNRASILLADAGPAAAASTPAAKADAPVKKAKRASKKAAVADVEG